MVDVTRRGFLSLFGTAAVAAATLYVVETKIIKLPSLIVPDDFEFYANIKGRGVEMHGWDKLNVIRQFMIDHASAAPFRLDGYKDPGALISALAKYGDKISISAG